jgi:hypothetical protein
VTPAGSQYGHDRAACGAALAALVTVLTHGTAAAATAHVDTGTVVYVAGAGEVNDLEISEVAGGEARRHRRHNHAGPGCTAVTPNEVTCTASVRRRRLMDMDDTGAVVAGNAFGELSGGTGDDTLTVCSSCDGALGESDG